MPRAADTASDRELIEAARDAIRRNYDVTGELHTVGSAIRCGSGAIYSGVNVCNVHGACAEVVALGAAITAERERKSQHAIAVDDQWRICFRFEGGDAYDVEVTDYH